jgi:hypothetical protein
MTHGELSLNFNRMTHAHNQTLTDYENYEIEIPNNKIEIPPLDNENSHCPLLCAQ